MNGYCKMCRRYIIGDKCPCESNEWKSRALAAEKERDAALDVAEQRRNRAKDAEQKLAKAERCIYERWCEYIRLENMCADKGEPRSEQHFYARLECEEIMRHLGLDKDKK